MASARNVCDACEMDELYSLCAICGELYCQECTRCHGKSKVTRSHALFKVCTQDDDLRESETTAHCGNDCGEFAVCLCLECKQLLCETCIKPHSRQKATKDHLIFAIKEIQRLDDSDSLLSDLHTKGNIRQPSIASSAQASIEKRKFTGIYSNEIMTSAPGDKEVTRVRGIAILTDGRIVVADYKNQNLKLYGIDFKFIHALNIKNDPRGMVATNNDIVAVTIADKKEIRLFRFENKVRNHGTHKVKDKPFSIAYNKDRFAVEHGEGEDGVIRFYDLKFKEILSIPGNQRTFGQFTGNTIRLALDVTRGNLFVVDVAKEAIHCVEFKINGQWRILWTVKANSPRGIVLVKDTLFVACSGDNRIVQMSVLDGLARPLLDEDNRVKRPRYIAYQPKLRLLAVDIDGNHVKLYQIT